MRIAPTSAQSADGSKPEAAEEPRPSNRLRRGLLGVAAVRAVVSVLAILAAPALYEDHFVVLVLLRPTKEVLLAAGFLIRQQDVNLLPVVIAALPILIGGVWVLYALGRAFREDIQSGEDFPKFAARILRPERVKTLCDVIEDKGRLVVILGRIAAFPSSLLAAAAGASDMRPSEFLPADALGAALSLVEAISAGYLLGAAYKQGGPWITAVGFVVLAGMVILMGRWLRGARRRNRPRLRLGKARSTT